MSTTYITNYNYKYFIENVKDIEISVPSSSCYIVPHIRLIKSNNRIFAFEADEHFNEVKKGTLLFERFGRNNPTEIFDVISLQFPDLKIMNQDTQMYWPECGI